MAGNSFGKNFRITTFGESHGEGIGLIIDGCPAGMELCEEDVQKELDRRRPGFSPVVSERKEEDKVKIYSGVFEGCTTGAPIMMMTENKDFQTEDYEDLKKLYRPGHADFTYEKKYGFRDWRGGGRSSGRETWARVAAGAVARKFLKEKLGIEIIGYIEQIGEIFADIDISKIILEDVEFDNVRCPDKSVVEKMISYIEKLKKEGDSCGGVVGCIARNVPIGLGEPVFDKLPADLAKAMLSIGGSKGFEIGSGFKSAKMKGSEHNDEFFMENGNPKMKTNNAGGCLGGISCGEDIYFKVAFKPPSTISKKQKTVTRDGKEVEFQASGRHDSCIVPRAIPVVEAMTSFVLVDHFLRLV